MIEMICGAYGAMGRLIRPADGPFTLSAEEEKRLVRRGVARYVQEGAPGPEEPGHTDGQEDSAEPPLPGPEKPPKPKKPGKGKGGEAPPDLTPEDVVV